MSTTSYIMKKGVKDARVRKAQDAVARNEARRIEVEEREGRSKRQFEKSFLPQGPLLKMLKWRSEGSKQ
jgi:hypothetical protein